MLGFIAENLATIIGSLFVLAIVVFAGRYPIKKRHKSGCGSGCSGCPSAGICHPR